MVNKVRLLFALVVLVMTSCSHSLKPVDYVHYVEDSKNGLHPWQEKSLFLFSLQYKPLDYVALEELRQQQVTSQQLKQEKKSFGTMQYFTLRISTKDSSNDLLKTGTKTAQEYSKRQNYFDFIIQNDLKLIEGGDTLPCRLCHFVRNYGLTPYGDFVLGFEQPKNESDLKFIYNDNILGTGPVTFLIRQSSIDHIPQIKTD